MIMIHREHRLLKCFFLIFLSFLATLVMLSSRRSLASSVLSRVSPKMQEPEFWIKKMKNPGHVILTQEEIQKINQENLKKQGLYLCEVKEMQEEWSRQEVLDLLKEDWEGFGQTDQIRYGRNGNPHSPAFWKNIKNNINQEALKERIAVQFGQVIKRTDIRVFPTQELSIAHPANGEFDRFQHSSISPGSLIGIYHISKDQQWVYAQTGFIRGWIRGTDLAIEKKKGDAISYESTRERLVITGNFVGVFAHASLKEKVFAAQMGTSFPFFELPNKGTPHYVIRIPARDSDGGLVFRPGYISADEDVHAGFLPYTQERIARQAFKMLHQPYGWGEMSGGRDCSRFIMDIFLTFGLILPRNSKLQASIGIPLLQEGEETPRGKKPILDQAIPLVTTLRLPGHIMLYLGKDKEKYYAIHSIYGIQKLGKGGSGMDKIGGVIVSDLNLGEKGTHGPLFDRITDIRIIGLKP